MQVQDRLVLSTSPMNSNNKDVISPNPSMSSNPALVGHKRSNSSTSMPQDQLGSSLPLVRSRTAPQGQQLQLRPKPESSAPQIERTYSDSVNDNITYNINNNDWNWPQSTPSSPSPQSPRFAMDPSDPDTQEQALFEERLCEDIYGVAVRKINQNGKSNLRYVKCLFVDAPEVHNTDESGSITQQNNYSSNRSVSSRHSRSSRVSLPRFLSKGNSSHHHHHHHHRTSLNTSLDQDDQRSLLESENNSIGNNKISSTQKGGKVRVLSWGKKKEVTVPLDMFTAVRKGKVNDRTRRNPCESSRILSLVTSDIHSTNVKHHSSCVSLDIEAPTRLDRDKFAKAFARFLNVPLVEEDEIIRSGHPPTIPFVSTAFPQQQTNHRPPPHYHLQAGTDGNRSIARSIKSETTAQSWRDSHRQQSIASSVNNDNSIPDIALTASNSHTTNEKGARSSSWKQLKAPLPVVTMRGMSAPTSIKNIPKPPLNNRRSISGSSSGGVAAPAIHPGISGNASNSRGVINHVSMHSSSSRTGSDADDPPLGSLPSSTRSRGASNSNANSMGVSNIKTRSSSPSANRRMVLEIPFITKSKLANNSNNSNNNNNNSNSNHDRSTPATSAISAQVHSNSTAPQIPATEANNVNNVNNVSRDTATGASDEMDASVVSSITGVGFDQDLVEELHLALERMKVELEESRAEASRAVKVAEQAIQSAENSSSKDWNNTVTHKAAEAAATAQKKSAEAMAKARVAEERLAVERKASVLRKKQVKDAEQLAAHWQTRAAAAEVQRFAVAEALESERKKNADLLQNGESTSTTVTSSSGSSNSPQKFDPFAKIKPSSPFSSRIASELADVDRLRSKLAMESARRRKLLDELQDLRGSIRVYCRLKAPSPTANKKQAFVEMVSNEVLMLHRDRATAAQKNDAPSSKTTPLCYEFDGIMAPDISQQDVYAEMEAICASVVEGFKICVMSYGQANAGKTHTMLGDVVLSSKNHSVSIENEGIQLRAIKQLFSLLEHRKGQFEHTVTMNLVEVHDEKLTDLLAGTDFGEQNGKVEARKSSRRAAEESPKRPSELKPKLEIKTNRDGETVVRGVLSVELASFEEIIRVWTESLRKRSSRLAEQKVEDPVAYEKESHIVATLKISSMNLSTGSVANGKMQFVDFASSDVTSKRPLGGSASSLLSQSLSTKLLSSGVSSEQLLEDWKFTNKSLNIVREVALSRSQYQRSVPYRNSTITHLLSDSFEADTKVVLIACVSSDEKDAQNTACTLQLAQEMRKVIVGKATRHTTIASEVQKS